MAKDFAAAIKTVLDDADAKLASAATAQSTAEATRKTKEQNDTELTSPQWDEVIKHLTWFGSVVPAGIDAKYAAKSIDALHVEYGVSREKLLSIASQIATERAKREAAKAGK